jgi:ribosomal protein S18 acetylase RimI-like enzyme
MPRLGGDIHDDTCERADKTHSTATKYEIGPGRPADFADVEALVSRTIRDPFDHPDLTEEQRAENAWIATIAERNCLAAIDNPDRAIFVAREDAASPIIGFVIALRDSAEMPEIDWLIVAPEHQGKGAARLLMQRALDWIGEDVAVKLGVIHFNARAIAFYKKFGFEDTGRIVGRHKIPRKLLVRSPNLDR